MKGDREVYFQSERTGYSHLYTVSFDGGEPKRADVGQVGSRRRSLSNDKTRFFLTTSEGDPGEHQVYEMSADGGARTRITSLPGGHSCVLSPDDRWIADRLFLHQQAAGAVCAGSACRRDGEEADVVAGAGILGVSVAGRADRARSGARRRDAARAHVYKPANFRQGGPAVVFVHGAGYLQNVHRLVVELLARVHVPSLADGARLHGARYGLSRLAGLRPRLAHGDLPAHGRQGSGRQRRRRASGWSSQAGVDPKRIGIYGGSYGGFITLMAMFTQPDVFAAGAALRPVTDWAHYNHGYTSNILNVPQKDAEAYRQSLADLLRAKD